MYISDTAHYWLGRLINAACRKRLFFGDLKLFLVLQAIVYSFTTNFYSKTTTSIFLTAALLAWVIEADSVAYL
jgi:hypothetical protein